MSRQSTSLVLSLMYWASMAMKYVTNGSVAKKSCVLMPPSWPSPAVASNLPIGLSGSIPAGPMPNVRPEPAEVCRKELPVAGEAGTCSVRAYCPGALAWNSTSPFQLCSSRSVSPSWSTSTASALRPSPASDNPSWSVASRNRP